MTYLLVDDVDGHDNKLTVCHFCGMTSEHIHHVIVQRFTDTNHTTKDGLTIDMFVCETCYEILAKNTFKDNNRIVSQLSNNARLNIKNFIKQVSGHGRE